MSVRRNAQALNTMNALTHTRTRTQADVFLAFAHTCTRRQDLKNTRNMHARTGKHLSMDEGTSTLHVGVVQVVRLCGRLAAKILPDAGRGRLFPLGKSLCVETGEAGKACSRREMQGSVGRTQVLTTSTREQRDKHAQDKTNVKSNKMQPDNIRGKPS